MPEDFGKTGIDPDWYDHGPGSVAFGRKMGREMAEHDAERFRQRARDAAIVEAAEAGAKACSEDFEKHREQPCCGMCIWWRTCKAVRGEGTHD